MSLDDPKQQNQEKEDNTQQKVQETTPTLVQDDKKANSLLQAAALEYYQRADKPGREILIKLAKDLEELAGIPKSKITRMIVRAFTQNNVKINRSYIYSVLGQEYKNAAQSEASRQTAREKREDGYDYPTGDYVTGPFETYNIDHVADYSKSTLVRIVNALHEQLIVRDKRKLLFEVLEKKY
jgi:hypothetical protein